MQIWKNPEWKTTLFGQKCVPKAQDSLHIDNPLFSVAGTGQTKAKESLVYSQNTQASLPLGMAPSPPGLDTDSPVQPVPEPGWTRRLSAVTDPRFLLTSDQ